MTGPWLHIMARKQAKAAGLTSYFTGKPCTRGHLDLRNTANGKCYACDNKAEARASG